jgi:hypothetical protein
MVTTGATTHGSNGEEYYCVYACRRDCHSYVHSHEEIMERYGDVICMQGRMADVLSDDLGNTFYMARFKTAPERKRFEKFVQEQA